MTMPISKLRGAVLVALFLPLAACAGGAPQQPSDVVDDQSAESPYTGDEPSPGVVDELDAAPEAATEPGTDTTQAGSSLRTDIGGVAGRWAADATACGTDAAVEITASRFQSIQRTCEIVDAIDSGNGSVTATLNCPVPGSQSGVPELLKLEPSGDTLRLSVIGGEETGEVLQRCS